MKTPTRSTNNKQPHPTHNQWYRTGKVVLIICLVLVGLFLALDIPARVRYANLSNELERVRSQVMNPAGAVEHSGKGTPYPDSRGDGYLSYFRCITLNCPYITREWFVPIEPGKVDEFMKSVLQSMGYRVTSESFGDCADLDKNFGSCSVNGIRLGIAMRIGANPIGSVQPPSASDPSKPWRFVQVGVEYGE